MYEELGDLDNEDLNYEEDLMDDGVKKQGSEEEGEVYEYEEEEVN